MTYIFLLVIECQIWRTVNGRIVNLTVHSRAGLMLALLKSKAISFTALIISITAFIW